ncbi:uncharacterized protein LOC116032236 [Ipomoea triloba]|uniref:uncharacterized protein LOC116032236 n=1 Tax=Ipomoea triloba TaxID=35885 RepID=UPI00125E0C71|nr:uncharacterized protein LOC116032236 [Ipomoea triloba]
MGVFLLPKGLIKEIETLMNSYWWKGGGGENKGINWKSWEHLCRPKKWGGMGFRNLHDFNLSLLCKQAWRLSQNPDSLASKIYKARYYPDSSFLAAKVGANPSFIWRSLLATQDIIRRHTRWRIGNGNQVYIWGDRWLPDKSNAYVRSYPFPLMENSKVADLIDPSNLNWDETAIRNIFSHRDADLIQGSLFLNFKFKTKLFGDRKTMGNSLLRVVIWPLEVSCARRTSNIGAIYGRAEFPLSNGKESIFHLFVECEYAKACWNHLGYQTSANSVDNFQDWLGLMTATLSATIDGQQTAKRNTIDATWTKPQQGFLKLNVDVAIDKQGARMGFGCVVRDDLGHFVAARGSHWRGYYSSKEVEAVAIRESLSWLKTLNIDKVIIETDSLQVTQGLNSNLGDSSFHVVLSEIKNLMSMFTQSSLV